MSDKQDKVAPRTASDIIQKYNFGKTFAETMGLAKSASKKADKAVDTSTKSVQELDKKLDHQEVFNRLTKNGALQGLYRGEDGELYVNASFLKSGIIDAAVVQVVNLIAEKLKSTKTGFDILDPSKTQTLNIDGSGMELKVNDDVLAWLTTNLFGQAELAIYDVVNGEPAVTGTMFGSSILFQGNPDVFGTQNHADIGVDPTTGISYANFMRLNDKRVEWKDNGDGTYTLIGR